MLVKVLVVSFILVYDDCNWIKFKFYTNYLNLLLLLDQSLLIILVFISNLIEDFLIV